MSAVASLALLGAASAQATTVTLGSSLPPTNSSLPFGMIGTFSNWTLPGATLTSPFNGTITSWRVAGAAGGPLKLQVVRPLGGGLFTGGGTAVSGPITGTGVLTFQAKLPIKAGDGIGLVPTASTDMIWFDAAAAGSQNRFWVPPLADGAAGRAPDQGGIGELGFNATVVSNCVVPKLKGKKLKAAKKALRKANCTTGKVKRPKSKKARKKAKFVRKQKPAAGTEVQGGTAVTLKLGKKKKKKK